MRLLLVRSALHYGGKRGVNRQFQAVVYAGFNRWGCQKESRP